MMFLWIQMIISEYFHYFNSQQEHKSVEGEQIEQKNVIQSEELSGPKHRMVFGTKELKSCSISSKCRWHINF